MWPHIRQQTHQYRLVQLLCDQKDQCVTHSLHKHSSSIWSRLIPQTYGTLAWQSPPVLRLIVLTQWPWPVRLQSITPRPHSGVVTTALNDAQLNDIQALCCVTPHGAGDTPSQQPSIRSCPHVDAAVPSRTVNQAIATPFDLRDGLRVIAHRKQAAPAGQQAGSCWLYRPLHALLGQCRHVYA